MKELTPQSTRLHIVIIGMRNVGKSSLLNALTGQEVSIVSDVAGTTTDPVVKSVEMPGLGACVFLDTPGFDDVDGHLGELRVERMRKSLKRADLVLFVASGPQPTDEELEWAVHLREFRIPWMVVLGKADRYPDASVPAEELGRKWRVPSLAVSCRLQTGISKLPEMLLQLLPEDYGHETITGNLVKEGDLVLLVMPQDTEAPKGRLILPQVQTLRELLDKRCVALCCTPDKMQETLDSLKRSPDLIITDSQAFASVFKQKPVDSKLTSFSVLFAAYKGDADVMKAGAEFIGQLTEKSRVLIAEACSHVPANEDIGRVKLPGLLRKRVGEGLRIDHVNGLDFPADLSPYQLIIHCGACMFNRRYVLGRIRSAQEQGVPITNYGMAIAYLIGILHQTEC